MVTVTGEPLELALLAFGRQRVAQVDYDGAAEDVGAADRGPDRRSEPSADLDAASRAARP